MLPLLLDEGVPSRASVAEAMHLLGLEVYCIGLGDAPLIGSPDEQNCQWCAQRGAVLVTTDRGRKDRTILGAISKHAVGALFIYGDLRGAQPHLLVKALLVAERAIDDLGSRQRQKLHHRLHPTGKVERR